MSSPRVVIVGSLADSQAHAIAERLRADGVDPFVFDAQKFPAEQGLSLEDDLAAIRVAGERVAPASVYVRGLYASPIAFGTDADAEMRADWRRTMLVYRERSTLTSAVLLRWEAMGVPLYNPSSASRNITKPFQLALLRRAGLPVPETLWTNEPDALRRFAIGRRLVYKPVAGGAATKALTDADLTDERLASLAASPVTFQELLPGEDIRVYVLDRRVVCALRIDTEAIDFRQNETAIEEVALPRAVREQCVAATELLGLRFTGMDLKRASDGTLKILELNPSPMFVGFDARAGTDIVGALAAALRAHVPA